MRKQRSKKFVKKQVHKKFAPRPVQLTVGPGDIEFRDANQKAWPRSAEAFILSYGMMQGRHTIETKWLEFSSYEDAWTEAQRLGVQLRHWPKWLLGQRGEFDRPKARIVANGY